MDVATRMGMTRGVPVLALSCVAAGLIAVVPGCADAVADAPSSDSASVCPTGFVGDRAAPLIVELRALRDDGADVPLVDGGDLAIVTPPQGGRVSFVGVRAMNIDGCGVEIVATLRDPLSGQTRLDGRTVNLERDDEGFGTSGALQTNIGDYRQLGSYAHLSLCPNQWAERDVYDAPFELSVRVVDRGGRAATRVIRVTPRCSEPGAAGAKCRCICTKGHVAGSTCASSDAGP